MNISKLILPRSAFKCPAMGSALPALAMLPLTSQVLRGNTGGVAYDIGQARLRRQKLKELMTLRFAMIRL